LVGPAGTNPLPVADQTIFTITNAHDGFFIGEASVQLSEPAAPGLDSPSPKQYIMSGFVSPQGRIRIQFTPIDPSPSTDPS
jgi:hypothetical protein